MAIKKFLNEIVRFLKKGNYSKQSRKNFEQKIRTLFLKCYSETEENLNVFHYLKYGKAPDSCGPVIERTKYFDIGHLKFGGRYERHSSFNQRRFS